MASRKPVFDFGHEGLDPEFEDEVDAGESEGEYEDISVEVALQLVIQGEELIKQANYAEASDVLSRAVASLSVNYGESADEVADANFLYGKALYECAIEKGGLFASDGDDKKIDDITRDDDDEEDVDDLNLAFQVLTLARMTYERIGEEKCASKLAETLILLGNIYLEVDSPKDAALLFFTALQTRLKYPDARKSIRVVLEARYYHSIGLQSTAFYTKALEQIQIALKELDNEVEVLTSKLAASNAGANSKGKKAAAVSNFEEVSDIPKELEELKTLRAELKNKEDDLKATIESVDGAALAVSGASETITPVQVKKPATTTETASEAKENIEETKEGAAVQNITQLVRKKRKDVEPADVPDEKKRQIEA